MLLATDWATGKGSNSASQYELVIYLNLTDLKPEDEVEPAVIRICQQNGSETTDELLTLGALKHYADNILLILDGFERITLQQQIEVLNIIRYNSERPSLFKKSTVLLTSTDNEIVGDTRSLFQKTVKLLRHRVSNVLEEFFEQYSMNVLMFFR